MNRDAVFNIIRSYVPIWLFTWCEIIVKIVTAKIQDYNEVTQIHFCYAYV